MDRGYNGINVNTKNPVKVSEFPSGVTSYTVIDPDTGKVKKIPVTKSVVTIGGVKESSDTSTGIADANTNPPVTPTTSDTDTGTGTSTDTDTTSTGTSTDTTSVPTTPDNGDVTPITPTDSSSSRGITPAAKNTVIETPEKSVTLLRSRAGTHRVIKTSGVTTDYIPTYHTFSGHDMIVTISIKVSPSRTINKVIGAFQTITYSIHNEKAPVRVLGNMNAKRYVFGPRTIAGSLILIVFDRHWMREFLGTYAKVKHEGVEWMNFQLLILQYLAVMNTDIVQEWLYTV